MPRNLINTKSVARLAAIQTIYQLPDGNTEIELEELIATTYSFYQDAEIFNQEIQEEYGKFKPSYKYFSQLTHHTYINLKIIDQTISTYLNSDWNLEKLSKLLHSILRVAIAELKFLPDTPMKVVIDEYTNITANLLNYGETGFINSLLDKFVAEHKS